MSAANVYSLRKSFQPLVGQKTLLSLFSEADITEEYIGWLNDPVVTRFSNQRFRCHTLETCTMYAASFECSDNLFIKIRKKTDEIYIGTMTAYYSAPHQTVDVGIMIGNKSVWGAGYGQDAWNTLLGWLSSQSSIRKITAGTMRANIGMLRLMEQSGMTLEAVRPQQELLGGEPQDLLYYGKFTHD